MRVGRRRKKMTATQRVKKKLSDGRNSKLEISTYRTLAEKIKKSIDLDVNRLSQLDSKEPTYATMSAAMKKQIEEDKLYLKAVEEILDGTRKPVFTRPGEINLKYNGGRKVNQLHEAETSVISKEIIRAGAVNTPGIIFKQEGDQALKQSVGKHRCKGSLDGIKAKKLDDKFVMPNYDFSDVAKKVSETTMRKWGTTENQKNKETHYEPTKDDTKSSLKAEIKLKIASAYPSEKEEGKICEKFIDQITGSKGKNSSAFGKLKKEHPDFLNYLEGMISVHTLADPQDMLKSILKDITKEEGTFHNTSGTEASQSYKAEGSAFGRALGVDNNKTLDRVFGESLGKKQKKKEEGSSYEPAYMLHFFQGKKLTGPGLIEYRREFISRLRLLNNALLSLANKENDSEWLLPFKGFIFSPSISSSVVCELEHFPAGIPKTEKDLSLISETSFKEFSYEEALVLMKKVAEKRWTWKDFHCEY
jgi:hypothetical protein